jgi:hypothetical protein
MLKVSDQIREFISESHTTYTDVLLVAPNTEIP